MATNVLQATVLLGISALEEKLDVGRVTIWRWCSAGTFPAPIYVGRDRKWRLADVEEWIATRSSKPVASVGR